MRQNALATASPEDVAAFNMRLDDLMRQAGGAESAIKALLAELGAIKQTLLRSKAPVALRDKARALELEALDLQLQLAGDDVRDLAGDLGPVSVKRRIEVARFGTSFSTYGPTPMHLEAVEIGEQKFAGIKTALDRVFEHRYAGIA